MYSFGHDTATEVKLDASSELCNRTVNCFGILKLGCSTLSNFYAIIQSELEFHLMNQHNTSLYRSRISSYEST